MRVRSRKANHHLKRFKMPRKSPRIALAALFLTAVSVTILPGQTVRQASIEKTRFDSPMVLETVFAAADRSLWDPSQGHQPGAWFSAQEYEDLGRYSCDGVFLRQKYNRRRETWQPGLAMSVTQAQDGRLKINVRAVVDNPEDNHDRKVETLFEVIRNGRVIASRTVKKAVEEGDEKSFVAPFDLAASDLTQDPMTKLRVTIKVVMD
ncbi:MAG: hypothetical protein L0170_18720 [Acidobacteria bacterium]|nr:hypothetical protein [Acidobacteriota bacterium]